MDPTDEQLRELFGYGDDDLPSAGIIIIDLTPGANPFVREGMRFLDDMPMMVYFDRPERRPDASVIRYLGELLAPIDYRLDRMVREELQLNGAQSAYPKPPRSLGRSIPARRRPIRGAKLTCGGWR